MSSPKNAVADDGALKNELEEINPDFAHFCETTIKEMWGLPLIDQKTKAFITIVIDVVNGGISDIDPFDTHVRMAMKQGATYPEINELLLFTSVYVGAPKVYPAFKRITAMMKKSRVKKTNLKMHSVSLAHARRTK
jgi:4-carboxymuconolactone decarboxylase